MAALGSLAWVRDTNGTLGLRDRLVFLAQGVRARAATKKRIAPGVTFRHREVDSILPPSSALVSEAMQLCAAESPPYLFNHCMRAYFWARLLDDQSRKYDDEAVFVALMLHDFGLLEKYRLAPGPEQCFTIVGARLAEELGAKHGLSGERIGLIANAITLHLNIIVAAKHGREAELVRLGSGGDVAGLGLDVLPNDQIEEVCARHPRLDFKNAIIPTLAVEERERPGCRIAFVMQRLGFASLITNAPMFTE